MDNANQDFYERLMDSMVVGSIPNGAITYAKMQDVSAASKLIGRGDSGAGSPQEITLGANLSMTGNTLSASGGSSDAIVFAIALG